MSFPFYHLYCISEFIFHVVLGLVFAFVLFISILVFTIKSTPVNHLLSISCLFWLTLSFPANATHFSLVSSTGLRPDGQAYWEEPFVTSDFCDLDNIDNIDFIFFNNREKGLCSPQLAELF